MTRFSASTRTIDGLTFVDFPADGCLWWLRWVDYDRATSSSRSSYLRMVFSRLATASLDDLPTLGGELARNVSASWLARAHVGWLPVLSIGLVARDGEVVGQLGRTVRRFEFDALNYRAAIVPLRPTKGGSIAPGGRRLGADPPQPVPGSSASLLDQLSYPLPPDQDGRLLHVRPVGRKDINLLLPCAEVMRTMYAPHSHMARAILDGGWDRSKGDILDLSASSISPAGWRVRTKAPLREEHVVVAANLLTKLGSREASLIRGEIDLQDGAGPIAAKIPFEWQDLELWVACFPLPGREGAWFGYEVVAVRWPDPPRGPPAVVEWIRADKASKDAQTSDTGGARREIVLRPKTPPVRDADVVHDDPGPDGATVVLRPGVSWFGAEVRRVLGAPGDPPIFEITRRPSEGRTGHVSAGGPGRAADGVEQVIPQAGKPPPAPEPLPPAFAQVTAMLQALAADNIIRSYAALDPPQHCAAERDGVRAWLFPQVMVEKQGADDPNERWYLRNFAAGKPVRRAALVVRVDHPGGACYLIESEPRRWHVGRDGLKALAFVPAEGCDLVQVVGRLLKVCASRGGVWPDESDLKLRSAIDGVPGIASAASWIHLRSPTALGACTLKPEPFLAAAAAVLGMAPTKGGKRRPRPRGGGVPA